MHLPPFLKELSFNLNKANESITLVVLLLFLPACGGLSGVYGRSDQSRDEEKSVLSDLPLRKVSSRPGLGAPTAWDILSSSGGSFHYELKMFKAD